MKKIVVYGAGVKGKESISYINGTSSLEVVGVCDSDNSKWGNLFEGYYIMSPRQAYALKDIDGYLIAITDGVDVCKEVRKRVNVPVYRDVSELLISTMVNVEISGGCNAKCKYCVTGIDNRNGKSDFTYMHTDSFIAIYDHLFKSGLLSKNIVLGLYNWGEPFMNPDIMPILEYCVDNKQKYVLSTNASIVRLARREDTYSTCEMIFFSMPGFSQKSYDIIHQFDFENIKKNVKTIKADMLSHGFSGRFVISAHIYKFSKAEIDGLRVWADEEGIEVGAYYPYLAGNSLMEKYLCDDIEDEVFSNIHEYMFVGGEKETVQKRPVNYISPICNQLTIDVDGEIVLCCAADKHCVSYRGWGSILDINSYDEYLQVRQRMQESVTCQICKKLGIDFILDTSINGR